MNSESPMKRAATEFSTKISVLLWAKVCQHEAQNSGMYTMPLYIFDIIFDYFPKLPLFCYKSQSLVPLLPYLAACDDSEI